MYSSSRGSAQRGIDSSAAAGGTSAQRSINQLGIMRRQYAAKFLQGGGQNAHQKYRARKSRSCAFYDVNTTHISASMVRVSAHVTMTMTFSVQWSHKVRETLTNTGVFLSRAQSPEGYRHALLELSTVYITKVHTVLASTGGTD